ncbi:TonB-dependent receptor [Microbulbifer bruguierae]|uniref:TonB-dependent receptor n=1 Tax=Microbulbifer bruguierae TaxID=3029061 RepID=A0ABY8NBY3_9GAMM|nr:TonB-dependent receptor [Microbulbifer bruguierae]WGL16436.1 TonB-dependent receptor [Microbulbifer bruguierae]
MLKRNKLALSISAAVLGGSLVAPLAVAQDAVEEVTVTGIRASLQDAQSVKRNAVSIVDAISAEDVGKFPDKNVAESLSRLTGVGVTRDWGQGEKVTIRGAGADYNRTTLNGQTVASADWFILDNPARSFNYTLLPSTLIKTLEVHKSPTASQDEGSLGGTVVLRTHRPLDLDANEASVAVENTYTEASESNDPTVSGQYSWKNADETIGVLVAASYLKRDQQRNGFEVLGWSEIDGTVYPTLMGTPIFQQSRERDTYFVSAQFRPTDEMTFTLDAMDSTVDADNMNANWMIRTNDAAAQIGSATITGDTATAMSGNDVAIVDFINRQSSTQTQSFTLTGEYETDAFSVTGVVGQTKAEGGTYRETSWEYIAASSYSYDLIDQSMNMGVSPVEDADLFALDWIWGGSKPTTDEETYLQLDLDIPVEMGAFTAIKTGLKYREAERTQGRTAYSWHAPTRDVDYGVGWNNYLGYIMDQCPTLASCGLNGATVGLDSPISASFNQVIEHNRDFMEGVAFNGLNGFENDYSESLLLPEIWGVSEDITAFYVQGDFESGSLRGNVGMRYVTTDQASSGYSYDGSESGLITINGSAFDTPSAMWVTSKNDYSEFLPSLNLAFDLNDEMVMRASAARVMARQNWDRLSGYSTFGSLNIADPKGTAGNPNLKPTIANQLDFGYEWYYGEASAFAATVFFKDIDSYIAQDTYTEARYYENDDTWVDVDFAVPVNGEGGNVTGIELAIDHAFDNGFGVSANYTYTDVSNVEGAVGISENMANLQGYYENGLVSARMMYNYRDDYFEGLNNFNSPVYTKAFGQLDASIAFNVTDNAQITLEAVNLNDEAVEQYSGEEYRLTSLYENGRRFVVGARYKF